jgi:hypothetical protein
MRTLYSTSSALLRVALFTLIAGSLAAIACVGDEPNANKAQSDASADAPGPSPNDAATQPDQSTPPPPDPICDALISYWPGEASSLDLKKNHDLSWKPNLASAKYAVGKFGAAFAFDKQSPASLESQNISDMSELDSLTLSFWYSTAAVNEPFFELSATSGKSLSLASVATGFTIRIGGEDIVAPFLTTVTTAAFNHVALVLRSEITGSIVDFYVNGQAVGQPVNLQTRIQKGTFKPSSVLSIATSTTVGAGGFSGRLDEIMLLKRALTPTEVRRLNDSGLSCGGALTRPDVGTELFRCQPPANPKVQCEGTTCTVGNVCCTGGTRFTPACAPSCLATERGLACATQSDCQAKTTPFCCLKSPSIKNVECTNTMATATQSTCKSSCDADELQLCSTTVDCTNGAKCTGFTAKRPQGVTGSADYKLGACIP